MGLSLEVGILADMKQHDAEGYEYYLKEFAKINAKLKEKSIPEHSEPEHLDDGVWSAAMQGYSGLHYVRRLAAHLYYGTELPSPASEDETSTADPLIEKLNAEIMTFIGGNMPRKRDLPETRFTHLVFHADNEGVYLPIDFPHVVMARGVTGFMIGSSQRLLEELVYLADKLDLPLDDPGIDIWKFAGSPVVDKSAPLWQQYGRETAGIYQLYQGASNSIKKKAALVFV